MHLADIQNFLVPNQIAMYLMSINGLNEPFILFQIFCAFFWFLEFTHNIAHFFSELQTSM